MEDIVEDIVEASVKGAFGSMQYFEAMSWRGRMITVNRSRACALLVEVEDAKKDALPPALPFHP